MDIKKSIPTPLPIGQSSFDSMIENGYYYVDKTLFIRDILAKKASVILCTRPRRFGKTLNQTMLKCFFEDTAQIGGKDTRSLFNGLKIEAAGDEYLEHQGKYPVIFLSFKEAETDTFAEACGFFKSIIAEEFCRHRYVTEKITETKDIDEFESISTGKGDISIYKHSLKSLSRYLEKYHNKKPIILIDEYDVPLQRSWTKGFYEEMIGFIRPLLSSALKDNTHLQFAVLTGCLRISKESIFTGLNNPDVISILSDRYDEYFGFTQGEMDGMLAHYGLGSKTQIVKDWYNGYLFGSKEVYNPWSSIHVVADWLDNINRNPGSYWANTSGNEIVRKLIDRADDGAKADLETLMAGGAISKVIHEDITYNEVYQNTDNLWNFMFFTGYLKKVGETVDAKGRIIVEMKIPNREVDIIYSNKISEWFDDRIKEKDLAVFFNAILAGDIETFQRELTVLLAGSISFMDSVENFYHGFMAGVLNRLEGYRVKSNRESGDGRSDLVMYATSRALGKAVIFEFKSAKEFHELSAKCKEALKQIEDKKYADEWASDGYTQIMKYGIAFYKKDCLVMLGK
jgi:hypothetical protein